MLNINNNQQNQNINFGRRLKPNEIKPYTESISKGLKALDKEVDIIIHNSSAPSSRRQNTGVGSLLSETYERQFLPFLKKHSITGVQQDPDGMRKGLDGSPYVGDTMAKNILMIPLEKYKRVENGKLIKEETFDNIVKNRPNKDTGNVDYSYVIPKYNEALHEAYTTFKEKSADVKRLPIGEQKAISGLNKEFTEFKDKNAKKLEKNAIYNVLSEEHGNDYWPNWKNEIDKNLYSPKVGDEEKASQRLTEIKTKHADKIDEFIFNQMLIAKSRKAKNAKAGIKTIGDSPIAFSNIDVWGNRKAFKEGWNLGCPPDYFSKEGQAWGFAIIEPKTIFNKDGSLGIGGKLMADKYESMFKDNPGGVRIDHTIGLIDPFVYKGKPSDASAGRLYSSPDNPELKEYAKSTTKQYADIIEKIVIPAAQRAGVKSDAIICEDLGSVTEPVKNVMKELKLRGIAVTEFSDASKECSVRGKNVPQNKVIMLGSHDNPSFIEYTDGLFSDGRKDDLAKHAKALAEDTLPQGTNIE